MKNKIKLFGIIVLFVVIVFSMTTCKEPEPTVILNWTEGTLANASSEAWYTFNVRKGSTYYVWVKEYWSISVVVADGYGDVLTTTRYDSKTGTVIFQDSDAGANLTTVTSSTTHPANSNFKADKDGTVHLRVHPETGILATYGKFKVAVTTNNKRPAGE